MKIEIPKEKIAHLLPKVEDRGAFPVLLGTAGRFPA